MKKRMFSLLLVIVMVAAMLPVTFITTSAASIGEDDVVSGVVLRKGDVIIRNGELMTLYIVSSPSTTSGGTKIPAGASWTCDQNYYCTGTSGINTIYLYPIPDMYITFDPNGGTAGGTTGTKEYPVIYGSQDYYEVNWLSPYKPGCTFLGWFKGSEQVYSASGYALNGTYWKDYYWKYLASITVTAKWKVNTSITFRYHPNGGNQPDNYEQWKAPADYFETYSSDSHWNYANPGDKYYMTRTGYTATGYYAKADGSCSVHQDDSFTSYTQLCQAYGLNPDNCGNAVVDIYAQWIPNVYQVVFNGNGATGGSTAAENFVYDTAQNLTNNGFARSYTVSYVPGEGLNQSPDNVTYTFSGWNTAANGSGTRYSNQQSVKNLTSTDGATINLYAQWTPGSVTLPTPTKTGKVCTGWYDQNGNKVGNCGDSYTPEGNITLRARWETATYTVTWKNYNGHILETDKSVAHGADPSYDGAEPTKPDSGEHSYEFSGWSPAFSPVTGDVAYTAQFTETPRKYNLSFEFDETRGELKGNARETMGSVVTVDPLPKNGYVVKEIIAYKTGDKDTPVSIDSTSYSFTMPTFDVTVEVTWGESDVIYTSAYKDVAPTFSVTIPAAVTLGSEITVRAENVRVNKGSQVEVSVADASGAGKPFTMTSQEGHTFAYGITVDGTEISTGENVLVVNPDTASEGQAVVKFEKPRKAIYAGDYSGGAVFTITVQSVENP